MVLSASLPKFIVHSTPSTNSRKIVVDLLARIAARTSGYPPHDFFDDLGSPNAQELVGGQLGKFWSGRLSIVESQPSPPERPSSNSDDGPISLHDQALCRIEPLKWSHPSPIRHVIQRSSSEATIPCSPAGSPHNLPDDSYSMPFFDSRLQPPAKIHYSLWVAPRPDKRNEGHGQLGVKRGLEGRRQGWYPKQKHTEGDPDILVGRNDSISPLEKKVAYAMRKDEYGKEIGKQTDEKLAVKWTLNSVISNFFMDTFYVLCPIFVPFYCFLTPNPGMSLRHFIFVNTLNQGSARLYNQSVFV
ncbi:hypothetical protein DL96DRAFT_1551230 [Flagelloscypha sp. PMI_526]|nr:hypothetical protein DL96DRAFT_1551230 [Flagelloscypha sp. PMI_526]